MSEIVRYALEGKVAHITLDDGKVNALGHDLITAFNAALDRAEAEARAVVIWGRPGRFSAGFDLKVMMSGPGPLKALLTAGGDLFMRIYGFPRPVVIACTGHAIAGGALLVLSGDVRIGVAGEFKVGLNEVAIELPTPLLAVELARDRLDPRRLTEALLFGQVFPPEEAARVGYLDRVVPADQFAATVNAIAADLARLSPSAFAASKRRLRRATIKLIRDGAEADLKDLAGV
ncbi:MAG: crotonase/enoyl-CoA hydratase family protein [Myxococcales bacterium]|nr:crotonase/enoyl-CoA hydratase family protein [Myxococcales bacterium]